MGLDVRLMMDNHDEIFTPEYFDEKHPHSLSRKFCNLLNRRNVVEHEPELDQIAKLLKLDISLLYKMTEYPAPEELEMMDYMEEEAEIEMFKSNIEKRKQKVRNNIEDVNQLIEKMISSLSATENLYDQLIKTDFDTMNSEYYFSDFNVDKGEGYIHNNFGQDLRNMKRFIEFSMKRGSKSIWFEFG